MRILNTCEDELAELIEFRKTTLLGCAEIHRRKGDDEVRDQRIVVIDDDDDRVEKAVSAEIHVRKDDEEVRGKRIVDEEIVDDDEKVVCVTSGVSYLGFAVVNQLLNRGFSVRVVVHSEADIGKLSEMEMNNKNKITAVVAKLTEVESLSEAFDGCCAVLHTSAFVDPAGLSGFSKTMAEIEVKASENVIKACAKTPSVRKCVFTSSLLACIWRDTLHGNPSSVINHESWSDELVCTNKKLWYALGKLRAEKAAWRIAKEKGLKLTTICPGLITGPEFSCRSSTTTIAYLKGAQEMYARGLLATSDVNKLAEAHVCVLENMSKMASGRYICYDQLIISEDEALKLAENTGIPTNILSGSASGTELRPRLEISNRKLLHLMSRTQFPCYRESLQSN